MEHGEPKIVPYGDRALLLQWENRIAMDIHDQVLTMSRYLRNRPPTGLTSLIPAYASLVLRFDPEITERDTLVNFIRNIQKPMEKDPVQGRRWKLPVAYGGDYGPDLSALSDQWEMAESDIIRLHTASEYRVFMLGFLPGFPYLGPTHERLKVERRLDPRPKVPGGSVGLAGRQTGIYPMEAPGGWQLIGCCPVPVFEMERNDPFLLNPGDVVVFEPTSPAAFEQIKKDWQKGTLNRSDLHA